MPIMPLPILSNLTSLELFDNVSSESLISYDKLSQMTLLRSLKINHRVQREVWNRDREIIMLPSIDRSHLTSLVHLTELNTWDDDIEDDFERFFARLERRYGVNYEVLDYMKELKVAKLQILVDLDCAMIQKRYPEVRFEWCKKKGAPKTPTFSFYGAKPESNVDHYYEGEFSGGSTYGGKGVLTFPNGDRYEGELESNLFHGFGVYLYSEGTKEEATWKNGKKEGKAKVFYSNGDRFEGYYVNDLREGTGVYTYANGNEFVGIYENDELSTQTS